jgi:hypothetical protein
MSQTIFNIQSAHNVNTVHSLFLKLQFQPFDHDDSKSRITFDFICVHMLQFVANAFQRSHPRTLKTGTE